MRGNMVWALGVSLAIGIPASTSFADSIPIGFVSYDVTGTGTAQFDVNNETGVNSTGDATFPVTSPVSLSDLSLLVSFASGPDEIFGSSYFTVNADGISWTGNPLSTGIAQPGGLAGAVSATLTGTFDTTTLLEFDGTIVTIDPNFSATISDPLGLSDGDFGLIDATAAGTPPVVPEPPPFFLLGTGTLALLGLRLRRMIAVRLHWLSRVRLDVGPAPSLLALAGIIVLGISPGIGQSIHLNQWTNPSSGASGSTIVTLSGSGFPSGTVTPSSVTLSFSNTCGGISAATESPNSVTTILGGFKRLSLLVPASLDTGNFYISVSDGTYASTNCAEISVTHTSSTLAACLPSSSLAVLTGKNVDAYVPKGAWDYGTTGISLVPIEGTDTPVAIPTSGIINSCSSNSATGESVCVDNGTNVYLLKGSSIINTLTSGANNYAYFSGGSCKNCGVAIDALTNMAVIAGGFSNSNPSGQGLQLLNLANNTFSDPFYSQNDVSENVSVDPNRNLILSPDEGDNYDLYKINTDGSLTEYANYQPVGGEFDSAAEDCTTGIALSTQEFTNNLFITDLTQATFTPPSGGGAGSWSAPSQSVYLNTYWLSAGTSGISVAAGTTHLGITMGEFGGSSFVAFRLPATSGSGTPNLVDYVGAFMPNTPDGNSFNAGYDPHTITAYTSPNDGKAYGLVVDWIYGYPTYVGVVDLQALLNAPRSSSNTVDSGYDLLANGIVRYIPVP